MIWYLVLLFSIVLAVLMAAAVLIPFFEERRRRRFNAAMRQVVSNLQLQQREGRDITTDDVVRLMNTMSVADYVDSPETTQVAITTILDQVARSGANHQEPRHNGEGRLVLGSKQQALAYYQQALKAFREVGDQAGEATTLASIGEVYDDLGDKRDALTYYERALAAFRELGDRAGEAATLNNIGRIYDDLGNQQSDDGRSGREPD